MLDEKLGNHAVIGATPPIANIWFTPMETVEIFDT